MQRTYLPYIDGLRAIAVLSVMIFHINPAWLAGGFVGVDMFFVISGFIVSYSIANRKYANFRSYLADFYTRRIKRIFPALILVVLVTALFTTLFIPGSWLSAVNYSTGMFALFGLSNFILVNNHRDYFGATTDFNPYTHTWSLGIEEQFYVLFPFLFYGWVSLSTNKGKRKNIFILFSVAFTASIITSFILSSQQPLRAYFMPYSRLWELALGAISYQLIYYLQSTNKTITLSKYKNLFPIIALSLIGYGLLFTSTENFPMPGAIPITVGTTLLILSLYFQPDSYWVSTFLSLKPINAVGKISYSLYLWHWPIFVLFRWTFGLDSALTISIAVILTFVLATISYIIIEKTVRFNKSLRAIPNIAVIVLGLGFIAISYQAYNFINTKTHILAQSTVTKNNHLWYPASLLSSYRSVEPELSACPTINNPKEVDGITSYTISPSCLLNKNQNYNVYAIGDSHTLAYSTLFAELAVRTSSEINVYPNAGCPFIRLDFTNSDPDGSSDFSPCSKQNEKAYRLLKEEIQPGDILFLSSLRQPRLADQWAYFGWNQEFFSVAAKNKRKQSKDEAIELLRPLSEKGVKIVFEAPKPVFPAPPYRCSDWFNKTNPICAAGLEVEKSALEAYRTPIINSMKNIQKQLNNVYIWDPMPILCPDDTCHAIQGDTVLFFDGDHISSVGSQLLSPNFVDYMTPLLRSPKPIKKEVKITETVFFNQSDYTDRNGSSPLLHTKGLSVVEDWGRWSDASLQPEVELHFATELPPLFTLEIQIQGYGESSGEKADLRIGKQHYTFEIPAQAEKVQLVLENPDQKSVIQITPPHPTAPSTTDKRQLGIGFISMKITPIPTP